MSEFQILPKCPDCGRLTVDNPQHCPEKNAAKWATSCQLRKCTGTVTDDDLPLWVEFDADGNQR